MKILITGGHGLIGHRAVNLLAQHHDISVLDNHANYGMTSGMELIHVLSERLTLCVPHSYHRIDISDSQEVNTVMAAENPEVILHLASCPRQRVVDADPARASDVMIKGLFNLLTAASAAGCRRFVYVSSSMVYGDFTDAVCETAVCNPLGSYGIMKLTGEWLVKDLARRAGMEYVICRPSAVYGPRDVSDRVLCKFMIAALNQGILSVNGPDDCLDFTYVDDVAQGLSLCVLNAAAANDTFNITRGVGVSLLSAAEKIQEITGQGQIQCTSRDIDFPRRGALDITHAQTVLGYKPQWDLDQGLIELLNWLKSSCHWQRQIQPC